MKAVFVDTSGFYAVLDGTDPFHAVARSLFERAEGEKWQLWTTNYVVHETWALVQHRLGWSALDDFLDVLLPLCRVEFVDEALHALAVQRCRLARLRNLSLTDCLSFETMRRHGIVEAIANGFFALQGQPSARWNALPGRNLMRGFGPRARALGYDGPGLWPAKPEHPARIFKRVT